MPTAVRVAARPRVSRDRSGYRADADHPSSPNADRWGHAQGDPNLKGLTRISLSVAWTLEDQLGSSRIWFIVGAQSGCLQRRGTVHLPGRK